MARQETVVSVFVASPGDVGEERNRLEEVILEMNTTWSRQFRIRLELIQWETHAYPAFGDDPQAVVNEQIPQDFDIFIGLMWYRFGTPTGRAGSGTLEEFQRAKARYDKDPHAVHLMIYFKDAPAPIPPSQLDHEQLAGVSELRSHLGQEGGLYWTFQTTNDFEKLVRLHLSRCVQEMLPGARAASSPLPIDEETLIDPAEQVEHTEDADDDTGLLDLFDQVDDELSVVRDVAGRITDATTQIGDRMQARTAEIAAFTTGPDAKNRRAAKRLLDKAAADMDQFVDRMDSELPLFSKHLNFGMTALVHAATLSVEFKDIDNKRDEAMANIQSVREFRETMETAEVNVAGFKQAVAGLPPMTRILNRSKRAMANGLCLAGGHARSKFLDCTFCANMA